MHTITLSPRPKDTAYHYFQRKGLSERACETALALLQATYALTFKEWVPGNCANIPSLVVLVNRTLHSLDNKDFKDFRAMHYKMTHFFLSSELFSGQTFIFDPTGVPINYPSNKDIVPYFGLVESATGHHREVYQSCEPVVH